MGTVIGSSVIHCRTRASLVWTRAAIAFSMSRSVRMPISRPKSLTITAPTFAPLIRSATSPSVSSGATTIGSLRMTSDSCGMARVYRRRIFE